MKNQIEIHRVQCRACKRVLVGFTAEETAKKHKLHIETCETVKAVQKFGRLWEKFNKILGRKLSRAEMLELIGCKTKGKREEP